MHKWVKEVKKCTQQREEIYASSTSRFSLISLKTSISLSPTWRFEDKHAILHVHRNRGINSDEPHSHLLSKSPVLWTFSCVLPTNNSCENIQSWSGISGSFTGMMFFRWRLWELGGGEGVILLGLPSLCNSGQWAQQAQSHIALAKWEDLSSFHRLVQSDFGDGGGGEEAAIEHHKKCNGLRKMGQQFQMKTKKKY